MMQYNGYIGNSIEEYYNNMMRQSVLGFMQPANQMVGIPMPCPNSFPKPEPKPEKDHKDNKILLLLEI